jgi:uncharacterized OB-fold protein
VKPKQPAAPGWFTHDDAAPRLIGSRCRACGTYAFPKESFFCRNPACASSELEEAPLSPRGRLWSYTNNCYAPPPPYVAAEPFEPYAVAAVELEKERMVVLGQVEAGVSVDQLEVGMEMELTVGTLFENAEREVLIWKWRPVAAEGRA